jgi:glucokinase
MYLGIEIGGTKLQAGVGTGQGTLIALERTSAMADGGREAICQQIIPLCRNVLERAGYKRADIDVIGIGFGGPVEPSTGRVVQSHQVDGWEDFPLTDWLQAELDIPAVLGNDSDLAGLAEAHFGAGSGRSRVVYMNIGSGIGGAIVIDGKLYMSQGAGASEIGHLRLMPSHPGLPWHTLEDLASGWSLARSAQRAAADNPDSILSKLVDGDFRRIRTETLTEAVDDRDPLALEIWHRAIEHWGVAIANVMTLFHPEVVVLGGGVSQAGELLFEPLRREVDKQVFAPYRGSYDLVPAGLSEEVVVHGALKLARDFHATW